MRRNLLAVVLTVSVLGASCGGETSPPEELTVEVRDAEPAPESQQPVDDSDGDPRSTGYLTSGASQYLAADLPFEIRWHVEILDVNKSVRSAPTGQASIEMNVSGWVEFNGLDGRAVTLDGTGEASLVLQCDVAPDVGIGTGWMVAVNDPGFGSFERVVAEPGDSFRMNWDQVARSGNLEETAVDQVLARLDSDGVEPACALATSAIKINGSDVGDIQLQEAISGTTREDQQDDDVAAWFQQGETVTVECDFGEIELLAGRYDDERGEESIRELASIDFDEVLAPLDLSYGQQDCTFRSRFNQDFTKYVISTRSGHVVVVDLVQQIATDLTEPRVGSGFSDGGRPDESAYGFEVLNETWNFSDRVILETNDQLVIVDPATPETTAPFSVQTDAKRTVLTGPSGIDGTHHRTVVSPDGAFAFREGLGAAATIEFVTATRVEVDRECGISTEGWRDARTAVTVTSKTEPMLTTFDEGGRAIECVPLLPPNDREITDMRLRFDSAALLLTVRGDDGPEYFSADLGSPGAEPVAIEPYIDLSNSWRLHHHYGS